MKSNNYFQKFCLLLLVIGVFGIWVELHNSNDRTESIDGLTMPVSNVEEGQFGQEVEIIYPVEELSGAPSKRYALPVIIMEDRTP